MKRKVIALGLRPNQAKNVFSGQSMMFEALVEHLIENDYQVEVIDLGSKYDDINVGKIALKRVVEYIGIILRAFFIFLKNRNSIVYITTAQTKGGFYRDYIFINLAKMFGSKLLVQQFGSNFGNFYNSQSPSFKKLILKTFNKSNRIVVEGELTKQQFKIIDNFDAKVLSIKNGLPERNIPDIKNGKTYNPGDTFYMIYLSYMIESKGYWDVLHAVNILKNKYNLNVHCTFSGTFKASVDDTLFQDINEAKAAFEKYISDNGLTNSITYVEGLMGKVKSEAFLKSNVFLLPTYFKFEGQPVSVLEAMAYGSVPIVTNYRLIPEMVTEQSGVYVDAKSPDQIAESVKSLIINPQLYASLSQASVDRYQKYFTLNNYCKNLQQVIDQLN